MSWVLVWSNGKEGKKTGYIIIMCVCLCVCMRIIMVGVGDTSREEGLNMSVVVGTYFNF